MISAYPKRICDVTWTSDWCPKSSRLHYYCRQCQSARGGCAPPLAIVLLLFYMFPFRWPDIVLIIAESQAEAPNGIRLCCRCVRFVQEFSVPLLLSSVPIGAGGRIPPFAIVVIIAVCFPMIAGRVRPRAKTEFGSAFKQPFTEYRTFEC